jgi:ActR/RegA family two-component response regulator
VFAPKIAAAVATRRSRQDETFRESTHFGCCLQEGGKYATPLMSSFPRRDCQFMEPHDGGPAVLVLEGRRRVRGVFARVLRQHGYTPVLTATVPEAIAAASEQELDAVTLDLSLGVGASGRRLPVVAA